MKRLLAIGFIWLGCAVAWMVLGGTINLRTDGATNSIQDQVFRLWGPPQQQAPPSASYDVEREQVKKTTVYGANGQPMESTESQAVTETVAVPLAGSDIRVKLHLEQRRKGLLWFPTYAVAFDARYTFVNDTGKERQLNLLFPLEQNATGIDDLSVEDAKGAPVATTVDATGLHWKEDFAPGAKEVYHVRYRTRGTQVWTYALTAGTGRVRDFHLVLDADTTGIDFPDGTISPTSHGPSEGGWQCEWRFTNLIASSPIGIALPHRLDPGPVASRITFFAPVGLLFFFFVVAVFAAAKRIDLHPLNYFFLACAFFAFHLLFAYLVDHLELPASFTIASVVSIFLVVTYTRLFVGWRFALREIAIAQLAYLVLFSFTFFWDGYTGLAITVGAVATLFLLMQATGRVRWGELEPPPKPEEAVSAEGAG